MARLLKADGTERPIYPENGKTFSYGELNEIIQGNRVSRPLDPQDYFGDQMQWADDSKDRVNCAVSLRKSCGGGCEVLRGRRLRHAGRGA